jgi:hypothetical protein
LRIDLYSRHQHGPKKCQLQSRVGRLGLLSENALIESFLPIVPTLAMADVLSSSSSSSSSSASSPSLLALELASAARTLRKFSQLKCAPRCHRILTRNYSSEALPLPSNTATFTGDLTYYATGLGACGMTSSNSDPICAVSHIIFDAASTSSNPNNNPLCGRKVRVVHFDERVMANKSIDLTVVDRCVACLADDLDLSYSAFDYLADMSLGRVRGEWAWLP